MGTDSALKSFELILGRPSHPLEWPEFNNRAGKERLMGFDLSENNLSRRISNISNHVAVNLIRNNDRLKINFGKSELGYQNGFNPDSLLDLIEFKMFLNTHSTLVMGLLGRFESNVMTWVRPNNYKLIDRTIRYAAMLLENEKLSFSYEQMAKCLFEIKDKVGRSESVVMRLVRELKSGQA